MSDKKQTLIGWFIRSEFPWLNRLYTRSIGLGEFIDIRQKFIDSAKVLEKEQHRNTWKAAAMHYGIKESDVKEEDFSKYYKRTFGGEDGK